MAATVKVMRLDIYETDLIGPLRCDIHMEIADDAVSADAALVGAGKVGQVLPGTIARAKWVQLLKDIERNKGAKLPGVLDALSPVKEKL